MMSATEQLSAGRQQHLCSINLACNALQTTRTALTDTRGAAAEQQVALGSDHGKHLVSIPGAW